LAVNRNDRALRAGCPFFARAAGRSTAYAARTAVPVDRSERGAG